MRVGRSCSPARHESKSMMTIKSRKRIKSKIKIRISDREGSGPVLNLVSGGGIGYYPTFFPYGD